MIFSGKSMQAFASETIHPFLNKLLQSENDVEVKEALGTIKVLTDSGADGKHFLVMQKTLYHTNGKIAHSSLDILRKISSSGWRKDEVQKDVWKSLYPFFYDRASGVPPIALDSLKIIDGLIEYNIIDDYSNLQKLLLHKNDEVAHLALDVLRKNLAYVEQEETPVKHEEKEREYIERERIEKPPRQKDEALENRIRDVLLKNPKYVEVLEEVKSKYKTE